MRPLASPHLDKLGPFRRPWSKPEDGLVVDWRKGREVPVGMSRVEAVGMTMLARSSVGPREGEAGRSSLSAINGEVGPQGSSSTKRQENAAPQHLEHSGE